MKAKKVKKPKIHQRINQDVKDEIKIALVLLVIALLGYGGGRVHEDIIKSKVINNLNEKINLIDYELQRNKEKFSYTLESIESFYAHIEEVENKEDVMLLHVDYKGIDRLNSIPLDSDSPNIIDSSITPEEVIRLTNLERFKEDLPLLKTNDKLNEAALNKANHMFLNDYWSHVSPDGVSPWSFIKETGYSYEIAGENLARDFSTTPILIKGWMQSPGHRDNILEMKFDEIGVAVVRGVLNDSQTILVVQMFGKQ